ncbi:MAG: CNNM domain-containing protein [Bacilli bacterium]|nr:CNNM domain-containing protein [Bacilli bacterium]
MPDEPLTWLLLILYLLGSAYCSASETAFMTANRFKIKAKAEEGSISARLASFVLVRLENSIVTVVLLNNLVNMLFTALLTVTLLNLNFGDQAELFATIIGVPVVFVFGETVPKILAKKYNESFAQVSAFLLVPLIIITYPVAIIFRFIIWLMKKVFKFKEDNIFSADDFENVIEAIEEQGIINEDASELILSTLEFSETVVRDVITPKQNIKAYDITKFTVKHFQDYILASPFSRIPLYEGTIDKIVGVIIVREYIKHYQKNPNINPKTIMSKPYFVNYKINLTNMIEGFKRKNTHIAFVLDDNKKLLGMVTMEDVLEELVGQIAEVTSTLKGEEKFDV